MSTAVDKMVEDAQAAQAKGDYARAGVLFRTALASDPKNVQARYGSAVADLEQGELKAAEAEFHDLHTLYPSHPIFRFMRGKARLMLGQTDAGREDAEAAWAAHKEVHALKLLSGLYWMLGDTPAFQKLMTEAANTEGLECVSADLLRESGIPGKALELLSRAPESVMRYTMEAGAYVDMGNAPAAEAAATEALMRQPGHPPAVGYLITSMLMQGKAAEAMDGINVMRRAQPNDQRWIADQLTALRMLDDPLYDQLVDMDKHVRAYELPVPPGFASLETFNVALKNALDKQHVYKTHPLGQSLRDGVQTSRGLTTINDPIIHAYLLALDIPIRKYIAEIGSAPDHPLTRRNRGEYKFAGSWSVKLGGGGKHVNHVHSQGWISSSYYVSVPEETLRGDSKSGWIKFGEPPYKTTPPTPPTKWVQPKAGMLVLFPSYMWHGTEPINDGSVRVTAPFDVVPA